MHTFPEQKWEHQIKPDSKFLFYFVDILKFHSINQTTLSNNQKKKNTMFLERKCCIKSNKRYILYITQTSGKTTFMLKKMPQTSKKG